MTEAATLILPTEPQVPTFNWQTQKFVMLGQSGIGKSEFWAHDPGALFVDTEGNLSHLSLAFKPLPCRSWSEWREIGNALYILKDSGNFPYHTIIIDTMDRLADFVTTRYRAIVVATGAIAIGLTAMVPTIELNDAWVEYFDHRLQFRNDAEFALENLTGLYPIEFSLGAHEPGGISEPKYLERLERRAVHGILRAERLRRLSFERQRACRSAQPRGRFYFPELQSDR